MTGPSGDRYAGYLSRPGADNTPTPWQVHDGAAGLRQVGFQRDGSFVNGRGESVSLSYQDGGNGQVVSFRIASASNNRVESGINQDGSWDAQNSRWGDNLVNVRAGRSANGRDGYLAFESNNGKTDVWKSNGRQYTIDRQMPPMVSDIPGSRTMVPPVTQAMAPDGSVTDYQYRQIQDARGFHSQLQSYDVRDRAGNIKEFSLRNSDAQGSYWVTFKPNAGEQGLLSGMSRAQQEQTLRQAAQAAADPYSNHESPPGLAGRAVRNPYGQPYSESVSPDGHLYQTGHNGETTCVGDDGKTYHWHANGMQSITRMGADGKPRMVASDTGTLSGAGVLKDHYGYDEHDRINSMTESSPQGTVQYRLQGNGWQVKHGDTWQAANVDIRNDADGSVTIAKLHNGARVSARTIYADGGETVSTAVANKGLQPTEILSATGEHSVLQYDSQGQLQRIDENMVGRDGAATRVSYQADAAHPGHWQKITQTADGPVVADLPAQPAITNGAVSFGRYARVDHRGDLSYAERMAANQSENYADSAEYSTNGAYDGYRPRPRFRLPGWLVPPGARPTTYSEYDNQPGHRMSPVAREGSYYPVAAPANYDNMPWNARPWSGSMPTPMGRPYYARREQRPFLNFQINI